MTTSLCDLSAYNISVKYGFVSDQPSRKLPAKYDAWESIAQVLPQLLANGTLRDAVKHLPVLDIESEAGLGELQRMYVVLAFIIHGLVHGCNLKLVPSNLSVPFLGVCSRLGMEPVLSYAGLCLYNWTFGGTEPTLDELHAPFSFTGKVDEQSFYLTPVLVEQAGGDMVVKLLQARDAAEKQEWVVVSQTLALCILRLQAMSDRLTALKICDPHVFYSEIRPYIAGLDVTFEKADGQCVIVNVAGGSAAQSSLMPFLDHILGITHKSNLPKEMRKYMPGPHRRFLEVVE